MVVGVVAPKPSSVKSGCHEVIGMVDVNRSQRSVERRLSDLKRGRDAISRMLEQASLKRVSRDITQQETMIAKVENMLAGDE